MPPIAPSKLVSDDQMTCQLPCVDAPPPGVYQTLITSIRWSAYCMDYDLGVHERPTKQATCAPPCCHIRLDPPEEILKRRNKTGCPQIFLQRLAFSSGNWHVEALPACMRNMMWLALCCWGFIAWRFLQRRHRGLYTLSYRTVPTCAEPSLLVETRSSGSSSAFSSAR